MGLIPIPKETMVQTSYHLVYTGDGGFFGEDFGGIGVG